MTTSKQAPARNPNYDSLPTEIDGFDSLAELALDLRWSWNHATDKVWRKLDPALWELTQNPWVVLQTVSRDKLKSVLADSAFRKTIDDLLQSKRQAAETPAWFQKNHPQSPLKCVAYFSMEYMLSEALPIYSGGLGNVAGDQLKAASDLGGEATKQSPPNKSEHLRWGTRVKKKDMRPFFLLLLLLCVNAKCSMRYCPQPFL